MNEQLLRDCQDDDRGDSKTAHDVVKHEVLSGRALLNISRKMSPESPAEFLFSIGPFDSEVDIAIFPARKGRNKRRREVEVYFLNKDDPFHFGPLVTLREARADMFVEWVPVSPKLVMVN